VEIFVTVDSAEVSERRVNAVDGPRLPGRCLRAGGVELAHDLPNGLSLGVQTPNFLTLGGCLLAHGMRRDSEPPQSLVNGRSGPHPMLTGLGVSVRESIADFPRGETVVVQSLDELIDASRQNLKGVPSPDFHVIVPSTASGVRLTTMLLTTHRRSALRSWLVTAGCLKTRAASSAISQRPSISLSVMHASLRGRREVRRSSSSRLALGSKARPGTPTAKPPTTRIRWRMGNGRTWTPTRDLLHLRRSQAKSADVRCRPMFAISRGFRRNLESADVRPFSSSSKPLATVWLRVPARSPGPGFRRQTSGFRVRKSCIFLCPEPWTVFRRDGSRKLPPDVQRRTHRRLLLLDAAESFADLRAPPGNRLERLSGNRAGQHSIRVNDQWRICFRWERSDAHDVEITDYH
jgi:proteic killer suppression protein